MEGAIGDIKARNHETKEYVLDDGSDVKAVECIPSSRVDANERKKVLALDDLNVYSAYLYADVSAKEEGSWSIQ